MTRTIVALASAIAAVAAYGTAAQACISCDYVPEVLKSGASGGGSYQARPSKRVRDYTEQRERRSSKKRVTKEESAPKERKREASREDASTPAVSVAAAKSEAQTEHSAITTTGAAIANQVKAAITPPVTGPQTENSTISTATAAAADKPADAKPVEHVAADKNVGCKKYFPSTGLTLSVPCE